MTKNISDNMLTADGVNLSTLIRILPVPLVILLGAEQTITVVNDALLKLWGRNENEVLGKRMLEVFPELSAQPYPKLWSQVLNTGVPVVNLEQRVSYRNSDGNGFRSFYIDYHCQPVSSANGQRIGVISTVIDVTGKVESRQRIEIAESQLRLAVESSNLGTWSIDLKTREFLASPRLKEIFGFYRDEDMPCDAATSQILDEYRDKVTDAVDQAINFDIDYDIEYPIRGLHDGTIRWVRATGKPYQGDESTPGHFSGTIQDITIQKLEEQRKDDFISIASHELKTPVTSLKGVVQLLERSKDDLSGPAIPKLIDQANRSVDRITNLINDLLNTTKTTEGQLHLNIKEFNIARMLHQSLNDTPISEKHQIIIDGDEDITIHADEQRVVQVVINFVNNAVKYAPDSQKIYVKIEDLVDTVKVSVEDNGPGISDDKIPHLFNRYYRVDLNGSQYSGLGLGLYISAEIIRRHNGRIGVNSSMGQGSIFWFTLPR